MTDSIPTVKDLMTLTLKSESCHIKQSYTNSKILDAFAVNDQRTILAGLTKIKQREQQDKFESLICIEDNLTI